MHARGSNGSDFIIGNSIKSIWSGYRLNFAYPYGKQCVFISKLCRFLSALLQSIPYYSRCGHKHTYYVYYCCCCDKGPKRSVHQRPKPTWRCVRLDGCVPKSGPICWGRPFCRRFAFNCMCRQIEHRHFGRPSPKQAPRLSLASHRPINSLADCEPFRWDALFVWLHAPLPAIHSSYCQCQRAFQ